MQAGVELAHQRRVDRPMSRQTRETGEGCRADLDRIMCLATGGGPRMAVVKMGFIHYIKFRG